MNKCYDRINWENYPSDKTPLNEQNLNRIDVATDEMDNRIIVLDTEKATKVEVSTLFKEVSYEEQTGIITFTRKNGATVTIDTPMEKIQTGIYYNPDSEKLVLPLIDGTSMEVDLSRLMKFDEFVDSDTIAFSVKSNGTVTAIVKEGSIEERHLRPDYLADIRLESAKAAASAAAADTSEKAAKASETAAKEYETNAATSAAESSNKATEAATYAETAAQRATEAGLSAAAAETSATEAEESAVDSAASADISVQHAATASSEADKAAGSAATATTKAEESAESAGLSQSYAVGTGGEVRENDDTDCAEYYYEQAKRVIQGVSGIVPMGTITFEGLADTEHQKTGYMFNISDSFLSDERFVDGGGIFYGAGNNVIYTADGMWDVLAGAMVSGVKGSDETEYRQGFVNLSPENIGAVDKTGDTMTGELVPAGGIRYVGKNNYIAYPEDGELHLEGFRNIGHLIITFPVSWSFTMFKFSVSIFEYGMGESTDYHIAGYNYGDTPDFVNCTAVCVGRPGAAHSNLAVRFGHDGSKCAIMIGEADTVWNFPQVKVYDVITGHSDSGFATWKSGWRVEVTPTALPSIYKTITNTHVAHGVIASSANYLNANYIPVNTNLNSLIDPGFYYNGKIVEVRTFTNSPTENAFFMIVGKHAGVYQEITEYMPSGQKKYMRNYYSGTWGAWKQIITSENISSQNVNYANSAGKLQDSFISAGISMDVTTSGNWYRLGHAVKSSSFYGEFIVYHSWSYKSTDIVKFIVAGACNTVASSDNQPFVIEKIIRNNGKSNFFRKARVSFISLGTSNFDILIDVFIQRNENNVSGANNYSYSFEKKGTHLSGNWVDDNFMKNATVPANLTSFEITF